MPGKRWPVVEVVAECRLENKPDSDFKTELKRR